MFLGNQWLDFLVGELANEAFENDFDFQSEAVLRLVDPEEDLLHGALEVPAESRQSQRRRHGLDEAQTSLDDLTATRGEQNQDFLEQRLHELVRKVRFVGVDEAVERHHRGRDHVGCGTSETGGDEEQEARRVGVELVRTVVEGQKHLECFLAGLFVGLFDADDHFREDFGCVHGVARIGGV